MAAHLNARRSMGILTEVRGKARITAGRAYAQINVALLAALTPAGLLAAGDQTAETPGRPSNSQGRSRTPSRWSSPQD